MAELKCAGKADITTLCALDPLAWDSEQRRDFIRECVEQERCFVAVVDAQVVGYTVLEYTFYSFGFVAMLYVAPDHRREGIGSSLMRHVESLCKTEKIFTSTNQSNLPMQALLPTLGYIRCGIIENLDEGDPELVYFKRIERSR